MSVNSSSSNSSLGLSNHCFFTTAVMHNLTAYIVTKTLLLLPLNILVSYFGHQKWKKQRSFATTSNSDIFTYHMAAVELNFLWSSVVYLTGSITDNRVMASVGLCLCSIYFPGEISFHCLTCVEHYLAVVHPVTYLSLRNTGGVRIRNISIGCAWLLCFVWVGISVLYFPDTPTILVSCLFILFLSVVTFCSLSVLCVLIRPGPGEAGGEREQVDQTKQRAFYTITAIMAVLWLWFAGMLSFAVGLKSPQSSSSGCALMMSGTWFTLPSGLVLPLLFLHRAGKLMCCRYSK